MHYTGQCSHGIPLGKRCIKCDESPMGDFVTMKINNRELQSGVDELTTLRAKLAQVEQEKEGLKQLLQEEVKGLLELLESEIDKSASYWVHILELERKLTSAQQSAQEQFKAGLERGYDLGFAASGEGWNGEYGCEMQEDDYYLQRKKADIAELSKGEGNE